MAQLEMHTLTACSPAGQEHAIRFSHCCHFQSSDSNLCSDNGAMFVQPTLSTLGFSIITFDCHINCAGVFMQNMLPDCASHISSPGASNPAAAPSQLQASQPHRPSPCHNNDQAQAPPHFAMSTVGGSGTACMYCMSINVPTYKTQDACQFILMQLDSRPQLISLGLL